MTLYPCGYIFSAMDKQTDVKLWSVSEIAAAAGVTARYVRAEVTRGNLAVIGKLGRTYAISDHEAQRWLKARKKAR